MLYKCEILENPKEVILPDEMMVLLMSGGSKPFPESHRLQNMGSLCQKKVCYIHVHIAYGLEKNRI